MLGDSSKSRNKIFQNRTTLTIVSIIILGFIAYGNSLNGKFIWDDECLIKDNAYIKDWSKVANVFTKNIGAGAGEKYNFYRPLQMISYMIDYSLWKLDVRGYHLTNILLHILVALSIYWLINVLFADSLLSLFTSILFVIHPIHTEAVAYISGRADSLALLFMLLTFIFYIKHLQQKKIGIYLLMLISYTLALLSRENSLILPVLLLVYHLTFKQRLQTKQFLSILTMAFIYVLLRFTILEFILSYRTYSTTLFQRIPGVFVAIINYLRLLFFPANLHVEYGNKLFFFNEPRVILGILILSSLLICALTKRDSNKLAFFSVSWFFIALLPVSNLYPINAYMAEHWLYLPSIGFFLILAGLFCYIYRDKNFRILARVFLGLLVTFYSYLTIQQNNYWKEPIIFYKRALTYSPDSPRIYNNLAIAYDRLGKHKEAIFLFKRAIAFDPAYVDVYNNLAVAYYHIGKPGQTIALLKKSIAIDPASAKTYNNLAVAYRHIGKSEQAIPLYKKAIELDSTSAKTYNNLANTYSHIGRYEQAIPLYKKAIELNPNHAKTYHNLGFVYSHIGRYEQAIPLYKKAIELDPTSARAYNNLVRSYFRKQEYKLAVEYCDKARKLGRSNPALLKLLRPYREE